MALIFPKSTDGYVRIGLAVAAIGAVFSIAAYAYFTHPTVMDTGYMPEQPVPYSHKLHAGQMGMDCYYCHTGVDKGAHANIPSPEVCMNCHTKIKEKSAALEPIRQAYADSNKPIQWVRVHKLPDYVYFNHQVHVKGGVSCVTCHGRIDQMTEVRQVEPLSMAWCLDCHRNPAPNIRPAELVTKLDWVPGEDPAKIGMEIIRAKGLNPPQNCSGCHR